MSEKPILIQLNNLKKYFPVHKGLFRKVHGYIKAVDDVTFFIRKGETLGLVGESGCGKSTTGKLILRAIYPTAGEIIYTNSNGSIKLNALSEKAIRPLRKKMQLVFQDPYASLNPRMTVLEIIGEPLIVNRIAHGKFLEKRVAELMDLVGLDNRYLRRYPHAFSGGQRQRIGIARALALNPELIIADEPVSALDVSVQAQILNLFKDIQKKLNLTYLFISHDLSVVEYVSDRVAVMYVGQIVELTKTKNIFRYPKHPYTEALLSAVPRINQDKGRKKYYLSGNVADPANPPSGCYFSPRCRYAKDICKKQKVSLTEISPGHYVRCVFAEKLKLKGI